MSILLIAVIIVLVVSAIIGYCRGLLGILFNIFSWVFIAFFVIVMNPYIYDFLVDNTNWQTSIASSTKSFVSDKLNEALPGESSGAVSDMGNVNSTELDDTLSRYGVKLPSSMTDELAGGIRESVGSVSQSITSGTSAVKESISTGVSETVAKYVMRGIACLIAFVIAKLICIIVMIIIKCLQDAPVVHGITSAIGALVGVVKGLFITWLFMYIVSLTATTSFGAYFIPMINKSRFLTFLNDNNLIVALINYFF